MKSAKKQGRRTASSRAPAPGPHTWNRRVWLLLSAGLLAVALAIFGHRVLNVPLPGALAAAYESGQASGSLDIEYPQDGTIFPPDIAAPTFRWHDNQSRADAWVVLVGRQGCICISEMLGTQAWTPGDSQWAAIKQASRGKNVPVTVLGVRRAAWRRVLSAGEMAMGTSTDEVGAPIFYREVNLPFIEAVKDPSRIRWRCGPVSSKATPPVVLENLPVCGNCHSFSADGKALGMDVDYANDKGSYAITPVAGEMVLDDGKILSWSDYKREDGKPTFGLLSQVSPSGRYVVSTVKDRSVFVACPNLAYSQLFFPLKGTLCIYDRQTQEFNALPGADDPLYVQSNAVWSPDERYIVFARANTYNLRTASERVLLSPQECSEFLQEGKLFRYDLYRVPFNEGRGGTPEPLAGASKNGLSNFFAKYSPDGRWIVFCQAKSFMLLQADSRLCIVPADGGESRPLACNTPSMNSWHSWSPNSRWLVFSSKVNGPYTQLHLTHIDADGRSSPPVVLDRFTSTDRAANIPEFVAIKDGGIRKIREAFVDEVSFFRAATEYLKAGDCANAERMFLRALQIEPKHADAHNGMGCIRLLQGNLSEARRSFEMAIALDPQFAAAHSNLGSTLSRQGSKEAAAECYRKALSLDANLFEACNNLGVCLIEGGRDSEAIAPLERALALNPDCASVHNNLGAALIRMGQYAEGEEHCQKAASLRPGLSDPWVNMAISLSRQGKGEKAQECYRRARQINPACAATGEAPALADELNLDPRRTPSPVGSK